MYQFDLLNSNAFSYSFNTLTIALSKSIVEKRHTYIESDNVVSLDLYSTFSSHLTLIAYSNSLYSLDNLVNLLNMYFSA